MHALIVHNPRSGFGSDAIFEFQRALLGEGDCCEMRLLGHAQPMATLLSDAENFDVCILSGGDGTVASGLYALANRKVPTCVFPSGTANLLFESIGCAPEPAALAHACHLRETVSLDLSTFSYTSADGTPTTKGFSVMAGTGYDAQLMRAALPNKKSMGEIAYYAAALANPQPRVSTFTIDVDGELSIVRGICCLVANTARLQGGIELVPYSRMDDGQLEVVVVTADVETDKATPLSVLMPALFCLVDKSGRKLGRPNLCTFTGQHISITSNPPMPIEIDGEVIDGMHTNFEVGIMPGAARIIVDAMSPYAR